MHQACTEMIGLQCLVFIYFFLSPWVFPCSKTFPRKGHGDASRPLIYHKGHGLCGRRGLCGPLSTMSKECSGGKRLGRIVGMDGCWLGGELALKLWASESGVNGPMSV